MTIVIFIDKDHSWKNMIEFERKQAQENDPKRFAW